MSIVNLRSATYVLILAGLLCVQVAALAESSPERTLTVTGRGIETIPYTEAVVRLGVEAEGKTADDAQAGLRKSLTPLVERLKQLQVEKLQTSNVQLYPRYNNQPNRAQELVGFTARNELEFRIPIARTGTVLDAAISNGANLVQSVSFDVPDAQVATARSVALTRAVADARTQADAVLKSLGLQAKQIRAVQVGSVNAPPVPLARRQLSSEAFAKSADSPTPIEGGDTEVEALVTLQISY